MKVNKTLSERFNMPNDGIELHAGGNRSEMYANGSDQGAGLPIKIKLTNATASDIADVAFLKAGTSIGLGAEGNWGVTAGITPSSAGQTYADILAFFMSNSVKTSHIIARSNKSENIASEYTFATREVRGIYNEVPVTPVLNSMQYIATQIDLPIDTIIQKQTKIICSNIAANSWIELLIYCDIIGNTISDQADGKSGGQAPQSGMPLLQSPQSIKVN